MPLKAVSDAVNARLAANWTATVVVPFDTLREPPPGVEAFLVVQYPVADEERLVLGKHYWEAGAIRFVLNVMAGVGLQQGLDWSDQLKVLFRYVDFDGVETRQASGPIIVDNIDDGQWIAYSTVIEYRYQFDG
jgi:hypothetical protein